jgi:hypothetical protein
MKKAVPKPLKVSKRSQQEPWEREFDNFTRPMRRRDKLYWNHVILIGQRSVELIDNDEFLPLEILNDLPRTREEEFHQDPEQTNEEDENVVVSTEAVCA